MKRHILLVMLFLLLFVTVPALAQDAVPVPVEPSVPTWFAAIAGIAGIVVGAIAGGGSVLVVLGRIANNLKNDAATLSALEKLAASVPPETTAMILEVLKAGQSISEVAYEILDDVPAAEKVTTVSGVSGSLRAVSNSEFDKTAPQS